MGRALNFKLVMKHGLIMRESFNFSKHNVARWFPGHMARGIEQMHRKLGDTDCVVEVHDARIPVSGRYPLFENSISMVKPHVLVLNKVDLIDYKQTKDIIAYHRSKGVQNILFTNCKNNKTSSIKNLVPLLKNVIDNSNRFIRENKKENVVMIVGIPNVGKSSLINALRAVNLHKKKGTRVGADPGITKSVLERIKVSEEPLVYLLDTPGVLSPQIESVETGLKLGLVNTIKEHLIGEDILADYLLYRMNYVGNHKYVKFLGLDKPTDDIHTLLVTYALQNGITQKIRRYTSHGDLEVVPNVLHAASKFISAYRSGFFGSVTLDELEPIERKLSIRS